MQVLLHISPEFLGMKLLVLWRVGEYVDEVKEGDRVVPVFIPNCRECRDCKSSKSNICTLFPKTLGNCMPRDGTSRFRDVKGEVVHHFLGVSSFAEYTVVDVTHVVKVEPQLPLDMACLLSCGVATGVGAAWKVADVEEGSTVAIFGLGAVGLAVAEGSRRRKASKIIGIDLNPDKLEIGGLSVIKELTDGGADYCFECVGLASLMKEAFSSSREGWGKTIILGVEMHGSPLTVNSYDIPKGRTVTGCYFGGLQPKSDIPLLANKFLHEELNLDGFITHKVNFHDINMAFDLLISGKSLRCLIQMDDF